MRKLITVFLIALSLCVHGQTYKTVTGVLNDSTTILRAGTYSSNLDNRYAQIQDGLLDGGEATIGTGSVTIDTAIYRINKVNYTSLPRTFTGIANSPSGTQYYLVVYGEIGGTLDTISGARDTLAVMPSIPVNTVKINTVLVGDGGIESSAPDLSGYAKLSGGNFFTGLQTFNTELIEQKSPGIRSLYRFFSSGNYLGDFGFFNNGRFNISGNINFPPNPTLSSQRLLDIFLDSKKAKFFGTVEGLDPISSQDFVTKSYGDSNYLGNGTVTSITAGTGLTGGTITTSGTIAVDTTSIRTVANSFTKAQTQPRDATLTALAAYNTNGILTQTASDTFTGRTITGTTNQVTVTNGSGVSGNPTLSLPQDIATTSAPQFGRLGLGTASSSSTYLVLGAGTTSLSSIRLPSGVAPTSPVSGDIWGLTSGVRLQRFDGTNTKDFIFDKTNFQFVGTGVRAITSNPTGDLAATTPILETFTTDADVITAIIGGTYNKNSTFSDTISPASSKVFYKGQMYKSSTYLYVATNDNVSFRTALEGSTTGWATYVDNAYTVGSPFAIASGVTSTLPNNAASSIANNLPIGVTSFYNSGTSKIIPASLGDTYNFAIRFKAKTTATTDFLDFGIDIGGAIGVVFKESKVFLKGANTEMDFVFTVPAYVQSTFLANGGLIKITAHTGDLSIYDIVFDIIRTGKGIQ